ncbi:MAG TPA: hypothetical protein PLR32_07725 [candidate division Zixibacteria bacterium]|nr:hypothetical protein [candidate division Zixibacteria bacterium]MDD4917372.1 hypothetical protein [candidate division Zixibacteria bacterium]MDM7971930.1 hypothetical protein [candidate division Zixibacteria bacterium]HOD66236.1 hypothetical protein [candidate division Zixibacteria bacterium]HPI33189.1 hypothetical protein [candidate division Zixibacteria bacterium]
MAKRQSFADKASKKSHQVICPVCESPVQYVKHVKAEKNGAGWKFRAVSVGVCKCNEKEIYA